MRPPEVPFNPTARSMAKNSGPFSRRGQLLVLAGILLGVFSQAQVQTNLNSPNLNGVQESTRLGVIALLWKVNRFYAEGDFERTAPVLKECLELCEKDLGPEHPDLTFFLNTLAGVQKERGRFEEAVALLLRSLAIGEKHYGREHPAVADSLNMLAMVYQEQGDFARALPLFKQCLMIREKLYGQEHLSVATALNNLALLYEDQGNYADVIPLLQRSLAITEKAVGPRHPLVAQALLNLAGVLGVHGKSADALPLAERAQEITEETLGADHPLTTQVMNILAPLYEERGDRQAALKLYERCLAAREKAFGADSHPVAISLSNLGSFYLRGGEDARAIMLYRRSLAVLERVLGKAHPNTCVLLGNLAVAEENAGNPSEALSLLATAFRRQRGYLVTQFSQSTWHDALRAQERVFSKADALHTLCMASKVPEGASLGAEQLSLGKAVLEEVQATQAALEADPRTATRERLAHCQSVQAELKHLLESKPEPTQRDAKRRALEVELSQLEGKLAESVGLVAQTLRERNLTFLDIARNVPPQGALADFIQYRRYDFTAEETNRWKEQRYAAYMTLPLARDSTNLVVERVDLGEAAPID